MLRLGIFVFYSKNGKVSESVKYYLSSLIPFFAKIIIVSNGCLSETARSELEQFSNDVVFRENTGYDVSAWKTGIKYVGYEKLASYDELVLLNDSVFAPIFPLAEMFEKMESRDDLDFWGPTGYPRRERTKWNQTPADI